MQNKPTAKKRGKLEEWLDNPQRILVAGAVIGIGGFLTYKLVRMIYTKTRKLSANKLADDDPNVRAAMLMNTAMNPSGVSWMRSFDSTNEDAIFNIAKSITNLDAVIKAYRQLYDGDLMSDLQSELDTEDYQKFLSIVTTNSNKQGGAPPVVWAQKASMVVAKKDVTLRKTPDASYHGAFYEDKDDDNIVMVAKAGSFIGYSTGLQKFDSKNNVKFIAVGFIYKKDGLPASLKPYAGQKRTFWVSSSSDYVDIFPKYKTMFEVYPNTVVSVAYMKPMDYYDQKKTSGVSGPTGPAVVSRWTTEILGEKFQPIANVKPRTLLGVYLGSLNTGSKKYVKFLTESGTERWADSETIQILEP